MCALNKVLGASVEKQTQTAGGKLNWIEHKEKKCQKYFGRDKKQLKRMASRHTHFRRAKSLQKLKNEISIVRN